jgi:arylsulfatase A-like enzyme
MKQLTRILIQFVIGVCVAGLAMSAMAADKQPNIVYIVADDLGWKDVGFHGSDIKTPTLDKLAADGARLEQFYAQPMCTPTRAALMTGRYPFRYGLQTAVIAAAQTYGLPTDEWLLPQALKEAGYRTAIIGKWHLGHSDQKYWPRQRGFDYQYGPLIGEVDYFTHEAEGVTDWYRNNNQVKEEGYSTTLLGNDAVKFIDQQSPDTPFFLYLAFNAAHTPYQATPEYLDKYKHITDTSRRAYAGSITAMDAQIGRVVAALDTKGLRDNTLIVFMSDNGGTRNAMFTGAIADVSRIKIPCDNGPYREGKGTVYEGGTRVVAFANWPDHIKAGSMVNEMMHVVDMYPTLVGLGGANSTNRNLSMVRTCGRLSANVNLRHEPKSSTTLSRSVPPFVRGIGSWSGKLHCRRPWSFTGFRMTHPKRTTSPPSIRTKSRLSRSV